MAERTTPSPRRAFVDLGVRAAVAVAVILAAVTIDRALTGRVNPVGLLLLGGWAVIGLGLRLRRTLRGPTPP